jgi:glycerol-3-phosphate acyltransferase PlsY
VIGSLPTAYFMVRWKSKVDIRKAGSGNVGTLNSYLVTRSKVVGITVLIVDLLKGAVSVVVGRALVPELPFIGSALAGIAAVIGHTYPVWLGFKGGRGLAPAAGVMAVVSPLLVAAWLIGWGIGFAIFRAVNIASIIACWLLIAALIALPDAAIRAAVPDGAAYRGLRAMGMLILIVLLSKLVGPLREYIRAARAKRRRGSRAGTRTKKS